MGQDEKGSIPAGVLGLLPEELQTEARTVHAGPAVRPAADAFDFEDEPTLSEDLEDDEEEEEHKPAPAAHPTATGTAAPAATAAAAPQQAARPAGAAAIPGHALVSGKWNADEDDYDGDGSFSAAATHVPAATPVASADVPGAAANGNVKQEHAPAAQQAQVARAGVLGAVPSPAAGPNAPSPAPGMHGTRAAGRAATPPLSTEQAAALQALAADDTRKAEQQRALGFLYLGRDNGHEIISYLELFPPREKELQDAKAAATGQADADYARRLDSAAKHAAAVLERGAAVPAAEEEDESELVSLKDLQQLLPSLRLRDATEVLSEGDDDGQLPRSQQQHVAASAAAAAVGAEGGARAAEKQPGEAQGDEERRGGRWAQQKEVRQDGAACADQLHVPSITSSSAVTAAAGGQPGQQHAMAGWDAGEEAVVLDDWESAIIWDRNKRATEAAVASVEEEDGDDDTAAEAMQLDTAQLAERHQSHAGASSSKATSQQPSQRYNPSHALASSSITIQGLRHPPPSLQQALNRLVAHPRMLRLAPSFAALEAAEAAAKAAAEAAAAAAAAAAAQGEDGKGGAGPSAPAAPKVVGAAAASAAAKKYNKGEEILADAAAGAAAAAEQLRIQHAAELLAKPNVAELLGDDWEGAVLFDVAKQGPRAPQPVLLDLNDPYMVFESDKAGAYDHAGAMVNPPPPKIKLVVPPHASKEEDPAALALAHFNTSKDHLYAVGRKGKTNQATGIIVRHSIPANSLQSLPLYPNDAFTDNWHRPRARWSPLALAAEHSKVKKKAKDKAAAEEAVGVHFYTLSGMFRSGTKKLAEGALQRTLAQYWEGVVKVFLMKGVEEVPVMMGGRPIRELDMARPLLQLGLTEPINPIIPVWRTIHPLPTATACALYPPDSEEPRRPPGAFKTLKALTAHSGHLLLVEYLEEKPLVLLQPGMGLRLVTYYQRTGEDDVTHQHLVEEYRNGLEAYQAPPLHSQQPSNGLRRPYTIGAVSPLLPDDPSPFHDLVPMQPGSSQFAVDTPNFRAPAAAHVPASSDFVLVRSARGAMHLREANGCVLVGQQHPNVRVMVPGGEEAKKFEHTHFQVHVLRELRTLQERLAKKGAGEVATVSVKDLTHRFRAFLGNSEGQVKQMLKDRCFCVPVPGSNENLWSIKEGAKVPVEQELRKLVTPDMYCQYEALCAGIHWGRMYGVDHHTIVPGVAERALRLALDALPQDLDSRQAASIIELAYLASPWKLSDAYVTILKDKKLASFLLRGIGDPTARGRGFSFIREEVKKHGKHDAPGPGVSSREDGTITGTEADLRKLGFKDAGNLLLRKFNMPKEKVDELKRWKRIEKIRELCRNPKYAHIVNADPTLAQYVRFARVSAAENLNKIRQDAANIFAAQLEALHEDWPDSAEPDPVSLEQVVTRRIGDGEAGAGGASGTQPVAGRHQMGEDQAYYEQMRSTGMVKGGLTAANRQGGASTSRHHQLEANPGDRRIRRTITYPGPDGQPTTRVIIYTDKDKMAALNALYRQGDGFGERKIPRPGQKRPKREPVAAAGRAGIQGAFAHHIPAARPQALEAPAPSPSAPSARAAPSERRAKKAARAPSAKAAAPVGAAAGLRRNKRQRAGRKRGSDDEFEYEDLTDDSEADAGAMEGSGSESPDAGAIDDESDDDAGSDSPRAGAKRGRGASGGGSIKQSKRQRTASARALHGAADASAAAAFLALAPSGHEASEQAYSGGYGAPSSGYGAASGSAGTAAVEQGGDGCAVADAAGAAPAGAVEQVPPEVELATRLGMVIKSVIKWQDSPTNMGLLKSSFKKQVLEVNVPDYHTYVPKPDAMWLEKIAGKVRQKAYQSVFEFRQDVRKIYDNAVRYNHSAAAKFRTPALVTHAQQMLAYCEQQLAAQGELLSYWSTASQLAAVNKARCSPAQHAKQLARAIEQARVVGGDEAPPGWVWVACDSCGQWRLMTLELAKELGVQEEGARFTCDMDTERQGASCSYPPEYNE